MNTIWFDALTLVALLGSALMAGAFFAFSAFIMSGLEEVPAMEGARAMRSINVTVLRWPFMGVFFGTAVSALVALVVAFVDGPPATALLVGSLAYLVGVFALTGVGNVPLNEKLRLAPQHEVEQTWTAYIKPWTRWNHVRTAMSLVAMLGFGFALAS